MTEYEKCLEMINKNDPLDKELFLQIIETEDMVLRAERIEQARAACRAVGRVQEFNNLLKAWLQKYSQTIKQAASNKTQFTDAPLTLNCGRYKATDTGVVLHDISPAGIPTVSVACPHPILPVERLINIDAQTEKIKLAYFKDAQWSSIVADCNTIYNKSNITSLADRGVHVTSETSRELVKYLSEVVSLNTQEIPLYKSLSRLGWVGNDFAPYLDGVKYDGDIDFKKIYDCVTVKGAFSIWKKHVGELRKDISIRLMLDASFASVLVQPLAALPFVVHLWGTTGFGKTVSLMVASSVWGNPEMGCLTRTMNMTQNAMARTAAFLCNLPFCADELQQIKSRWQNYDQLIMYLTEGIDRGRARAQGGVEETRTWKNVFLFTGEEPVTKATSGGGAHNRVIEIEVDHKIIPDGNETATLVKQNYGHAGEAFIRHVQLLLDGDIQKLSNEYKRLYTAILEATDTTDKQAMSMALLLLADKISCIAVFDNDTPLQVTDVTGYLLSERDTRVEMRAYDEIVALIARNQNKFSPDSADCWGRLDDGGIAVINKQVLVQELEKLGFDYAAVKKFWAKHNLLIPAAGGKYQHHIRIYGVHSTYVKLCLPQEEDLTTEERRTLDSIFSHM